MEHAKATTIATQTEDEQLRVWLEQPKYLNLQTPSMPLVTQETCFNTGKTYIKCLARSF